MGGRWPPRSLLAALALCSLLAQPQPSRAFFFGVRTSTSAHVPQRGGGGREKKVPMTVVVPDYSPRPAPAALAPSPAPAPVTGSDGSGGDEDGTPRLPSERRSTVAPSSSAHHQHNHSASAQAPGGATSADFISSSPAVPLPAGVTDSATVLPMPTPGHQLREHDDVGMGTLRLQVTAVQLAVPLLMMLFWGDLCLCLCLCGRSCSVITRAFSLLPVASSEIPRSSSPHHSSVTKVTMLANS